MPTDPTGFASGGAAEAELRRLLADPSIPSDTLYAASKRARLTSIGGHGMADRVDRLATEVWEEAHVRADNERRRSA